MERKRTRNDETSKEVETLSPKAMKRMEEKKGGRMSTGTGRRAFVGEKIVYFMQRERKKTC